MTTASAGAGGCVHSVDTFTAIDGPGLRYLVFLQGCLLRCRCCANPDTWRMPGPGDRRTDASELVRDLQRYRSYVRGITISGGEPLLQPRFVQDVFAGAKELGMDTCIDTAGQSGRRAWDAVLPHTDRVLMCLKHIDPEKYRAFTGGADQARALTFVERLNARRVPFDLRYLLVPGWSDSAADLDAFGRFASVQPMLDRVELLPYHRLGIVKWDALGVEYPLRDVKVPTKDAVTAAIARLSDAGLRVRC